MLLFIVFCLKCKIGKWFFVDFLFIFIVYNISLYFVLFINNNNALFCYGGIMMVDFIFQRSGNECSGVIFCTGYVIRELRRGTSAR